MRPSRPEASEPSTRSDESSPAEDMPYESSERPAYAGGRRGRGEKSDAERARRKRPRKVRSPKEAIDKKKEIRLELAGPLPSRAIRALKGMGHAIDPVLHIGKEGVTEAVVAQAKKALLTHELIKVRVLPEAPVDRKETAQQLATETEATLVQVLGRTFLIFKRNPKKPKIELPK